MTGPVSTTFPEEEEDDEPGSPALDWVDRDVTGKDWDEVCPGCGGRDPGASAATPAAPRPLPNPADPENPEEEGFTLEEEEEDDLLDFPGIAELEEVFVVAAVVKKKRRSPEIRGRTGGGCQPPTGCHLGLWMASWGV